MIIKETRKVSDRINSLIDCEEANQKIRTAVTEPVYDGIIFKDNCKIDSLSERLQAERIREGVYMTRDQAKIVLMLTNIIQDNAVKKENGDADLPGNFFDELFESASFFEKDALMKDPYLKNMKLPDSYENFSFETTKIPKYSPFFYGGPELYEPGHSVPRIGFVDKAVKTMLCSKNGRPYAAVNAGTVLEENSIARTFSGRVLLLGCGMGHFMYICSLNPDVTGLIAMDGSEDTVDMINTVIADQIPCKEKTATVVCDAEEYVRTLSDHVFDYVYVSSQATEKSPVKYLNFLKSMRRIPCTKYAVENENGLRDSLRRILMLILMKETGRKIDTDKLNSSEKREFDQISGMLSDYRVEKPEDLDIILDPELFVEKVL